MADLDLVWMDDRLVESLAAREAPVGDDPALAPLLALARGVDDAPVPPLDVDVSQLVGAGRARRYAVRSLAVAVTAVATLSTTGVAAVVTGDPWQPAKAVWQQIRDHAVPDADRSDATGPIPGSVGNGGHRGVAQAEIDREGSVADPRPSQGAGVFTAPAGSDLTLQRSAPLLGGTDESAAAAMPSPRSSPRSSPESTPPGADPARLQQRSDGSASPAPSGRSDQESDQRRRAESASGTRQSPDEGRPSEPVARRDASTQDPGTDGDAASRERAGDDAGAEDSTRPDDAWGGDDGARERGRGEDGDGEDADGEHRAGDDAPDPDDQGGTLVPASPGVTGGTPMATALASPAPGTTAPEDGYPEDGYPEDGYPEDGYPEDGYPEDGNPEEPAGTPTGGTPSGPPESALPTAGPPHQAGEQPRRPGTVESTHQAGDPATAPGPSLP